MVVVQKLGQKNGRAVLYWGLLAALAFINSIRAFSWLVTSAALFQLSMPDVGGPPAC